MKKNINNLKNKEERRLYFAIKNGIAQFAPTISPAPKDINKGEIESITGAINLYKNNGVDELIIQKKYMGSYCDIELTKNLDNVRLFSRNGYLIRFFELEEIKKALKPLHEKIDWEGEKIEKVLIQAELMPWSKMARGLIEKEFKSYSFIYKQHLDFLKNSTIIEKLTKLQASDEYQDMFVDFTKPANAIKRKLNKFINDYENDDYGFLKKITPFIESLNVKNSVDNINKKYKGHQKNNYNTVKGFNKLDLDGYYEELEVFNKQVEIYSTEEDLHFKPFNILKKYYTDGSEYVYKSNLKGFSEISNDNYLVVNLDNVETAIEKTENFFKEVVLNDIEGIMIKPIQIYTTDVPHCLKVRNMDYLTMIYGLPFKLNYEYYLKKRNIHKKIKMQKAQWEISQNMLLINQKDINNNNERYVELCKQRFETEYKAVDIDSRL